jgi:predicted porin
LLNPDESTSVDLSGRYKLSKNFDVTAGVRLKQENDRLQPLTNAQQDSQAVYVGTRVKF